MTAFFNTTFYDQSPFTSRAESSTLPARSLAPSGNRFPIDFHNIHRKVDDPGIGKDGADPIAITNLIKLLDRILINPDRCKNLHPLITMDVKLPTIPTIIGIEKLPLCLWKA